LERGDQQVVKILPYLFTHTHTHTQEGFIKFYTGIGGRGRGELGRRGSRDIY